MSDILVIGSLAYDSVKTAHGKTEKALGGSANYFSLSASLFSKVAVVGVVGTDYSDADRQLLNSRGVDLSGITVAQGSTFHWEGSYEKDLNEAVTLKTELNVFGDFNPQIPEKNKKSPFVFLANIDPILQLQVLSQIEKPLFVGMDSMNFWINSKQSDLMNVIAKVDVLFMNETELKMLTQVDNIFKAIDKILTQGPSYVVVKRGEYGSVLASKNDGHFFCGVLPVDKVVDPTGAGDSFAGGFFGYLAAECVKTMAQPTWTQMKSAVIAGTVMSSQTIQDFSLKALASVDQSKYATLRQQLLKSISIS